MKTLFHAGFFTVAVVIFKMRESAFCMSVIKEDTYVVPKCKFMFYMF